MWLTAFLDRLVTRGIASYYHPPPATPGETQFDVRKEEITRRLNKAVKDVERYAQLVELRKRGE